MRTMAVTGGRWVRLALLLCTLVGLAAMHTLGHGAHSGGTHDGHDGAAPRDGHPISVTLASGVAASGRLAGGMAAPAGGMVVAALGAHAGCPAGECVPARLLPVGGRADGPSGWSVCSAVLGALGVALLVAVLLLTGARAFGPSGRRPGGAPAGPRGPPSRPLGLRLAEVSVSRT
ncbi:MULTISPECIES: hypothetical protein [unclassified Micromonospora]|uniref:hypothetical protein n=1 Tax=unclassified Micromonospora TaxID=2617518 RepID=UPI00363526C2